MSRARSLRKSSKRPAAPKNAPKRSLNKAIIAAVIVGLIAAVIALAAPKSTVPPGFEPQVLGAPSLVVLSDEVIDHGDVLMTEFVDSEFVIQNVGDRTLHILGDPQIRVVEGCCPSQTSVDDYALAPGEITTIRTRFTMHPGMGGPHDFRVQVVTDDPQQPTRELVILSNWI